jgi:polysaccharide pyruvyl transferase WcaK-like protein
VLTLNRKFSQEYYGDSTQVHLPFIFPPFLYREVPQYDGVVSTCGAMFMSKFSSVPSIMMVEALGIASAQGKLSVAYGGEAGDMDPMLTRMCQRYCARTSMIVRNEESRSVLQKLGIPSQVGADTAWTFEPLGADFGETTLRAVGWDGTQPVLATCPNNPFWWPVRPSLFKTTARALTNAYADSHYQSIYFHKSGPEVKKAYQRYVVAQASAIEAFCEKRGVFPILVAMERLDTEPCQRISERLGHVPVFTSEEYSAFQLVSILRSCHLILASRYHAIVTSMPGLVPSAGITMDNRIRNLMRERGHSHLIVEADDPELETKVFDVLERLSKDRESISDGIGHTVVKNLKRMAKMGKYLEQAVRRGYPEFPVRSGRLSWEDYLPPFGRNLCSLTGKYERGNGGLRTE